MVRTAIKLVIIREQCKKNSIKYLANDSAVKLPHINMPHNMLQDFPL